MDRTPALVVCTHGTRDPDGRRVAAALCAAVDAALPDIEVLAAHVDVHPPLLSAVVAELADRPVVVVPALLSAGYHVEVDIAAAIAGHPAAVATPALGPDPLLVDVLLDRLTAVGCDPEDPVVLGVAGSSRAGAVEQAEQVRAGLAARRPGPTTIGYAASAHPAIAAAVAAARESAVGRPVTVAAYLLAPGRLLRMLHTSGADRVTDPLGADPRIIEIVVRRYRAAVAAAPEAFRAPAAGRD